MRGRAAFDRQWQRGCPVEIRRGLAAAGRFCPEMYISGGAIRDLLSGRPPHDLDLTVPEQSLACARRLATLLDAAFVLLDAEEEVGRVVWKGYSIDFGRFREGAATIEADLRKRDFTINAMAVPLEILGSEARAGDRLLDPTGGLQDFADHLIRATSDRIFEADSLRMLRAHRFAAVLGFALDPRVQELITRQRELLRGAAAERTSSELRLIMASGRAHEQVAAMAANGLLWVLFPELKSGVGMAQPASHHLDVFDHGLAALDWMERLQAHPGQFFPGNENQMKQYLDQVPTRVQLKWAALFHDLGKPATLAIRDERPTFHGHDRLGAEKFEEVAVRMRWSREEIRRVSRLIELHMWPFHLQNARRKSGITAKALLRLVKAAGQELPGLFLLAMADSLAGAGPGKPPDMEKSLADLYREVDYLYQQNIRPVLEQPRLLTGHDLQSLFGLQPGPLVGRLLAELEKAQVSGEVRTREEAIRSLEAILKGLEFKTARQPQNK